jgi:hypothetical protein
MLRACGAVRICSQLRDWMGVENLSDAIFEQPDMVRDMAGH